jgi:hypothetical protein
MSVIELVKYSSRDTVATLKVLLHMALKGQVRGLAVCYRDVEQEEHSVFTGLYKVAPERAADASLRLSMKLLKTNGELD